MAEPFEKKTYYALMLDPVHVGTGGYRLGRVDNTIVREPGTNLPKIPGSSISGVARTYTAMAVQNEVTGNDWEKKADGTFLKKELHKKMKYQRPRYKFADKAGLMLAIDTDDKPLIERDKDKDGEEIYDSCAGKGGEGGDSHCGEPDCEVCVPFGFSKKGNSFQGLAQFYDARILFFPVHSMIGPVWVTSESTLNDFCETLKSQSIMVEIDDRLDNDELIQTELVDANKDLNLGWLLLKNKDKLKPIKNPIQHLPSEIVDRLVLVSDKLFSQIVNNNLEVRTSVAIVPATGAAEDGALFTYEAIPRATVMWFDVVYNKPEYFRINGDRPILLAKPEGSFANPLKVSCTDGQINYMAFNVEKGLRYIESLGVGGMNTRGMGRVRVLNLGGA